MSMSMIFLPTELHDSVAQWTRRQLRSSRTVIRRQVCFLLLVVFSSGPLVMAQTDPKAIEEIGVRVKDLSFDSASEAITRANKIEVIAGLCWFLKNKESPTPEFNGLVFPSLIDDHDVQLLIRALNVCSRDTHERIMERFHELSPHVQCLVLLRSKTGHQASVLGMSSGSTLVRALSCRTIHAQDEIDFRHLQACFADTSALVRTECVLSVGRQIKGIEKYAELKASTTLLLQNLCFDNRDSIYLEDYLSDSSNREAEIGEKLVEGYLLSEIALKWHSGTLPIRDTPTPGVSCVGTLGFRVLAGLDRSSALKLFDTVLKIRTPNAKDKQGAKVRLQIGDLANAIR